MSEATGTHKPASTKQVFEGVHEALLHQFGSGVVQVSPDDNGSAIFGLTVDGVDYSLVVNRTP